MEYNEEIFSKKFERARRYVSRRFDSVVIKIDNNNVEVYSNGKYIGYINCNNKFNPYFVIWRRGY